MRNKIHFYILSFIIIFVSVFVLAPRCKFLTETNKSSWPPPQILYKDVSLWSVLCKNNKVYVLATEGSAKFGGSILLFFIYDLKEGKWYGPERIGERLNNEILSHNRELVKKNMSYMNYMTIFVFISQNLMWMKKEEPTFSMAVLMRLIKLR